MNLLFWLRSFWFDMDPTCRNGRVRVHVALQVEYTVIDVQATPCTRYVGPRAVEVLAFPPLCRRELWLEYTQQQSKSRHALANKGALIYIYGDSCQHCRIGFKFMQKHDSGELVSAKSERLAVDMCVEL